MIFSLIFNIEKVCEQIECLFFKSLLFFLCILVKAL